MPSDDKEPRTRQLAVSEELDDSYVPPAETVEEPKAQQQAYVTMVVAAGGFAGFVATEGPQFTVNVYNSSGVSIKFSFTFESALP